ncbi:dUTPase / CMP N-glycosidase [Corynebacterium phage CL31]|nr:dUTPase / CMP N-glycosidase [Corynebacterium phage CL31]
MSKYLTLPTYQDGLNKAMLAMALDVIAETQHPTLVAEQAAAAVLNEIKMPDGVALSAQGHKGKVILNCIHTDGDAKGYTVPAWVCMSETGRVARPLMDTLMECVHSICDMSEALLHRGAR